MASGKWRLVSAASLLVIIGVPAVLVYAKVGGIVQQTHKSSLTNGCGTGTVIGGGCHGTSPSGITVTITAPGALQPGEARQCTVSVSGPAGNSGGGTNIAASGGTLSLPPGSSTYLQALSGELTHATSPVRAVPTIYVFTYTAPNSPGTTVTLYANGKGAGFTNAWNWAPDKLIDIAPLAPQNLSGSAITQTSFTANWDGSSGATSYRLDVIPDPGGFTDKVVNGTSQVVNGLSAGATYSFRVRAIRGAATSGSSSLAQVLTVPPNPTTTDASEISETSFRANWNPAQSATSYRLDVASNIGFTTFVSGYNDRIVNATGAIVTGLIRVTTYYYRVRAVNQSGTSGNSNPIAAMTSATSVEVSRVGIPEKFELTQNYPNPFNPTTTMSYGVRSQAHLSLKIYSLIGEEVATLVEGDRTAGYYDVIWDGKNARGAPVASGVYLSRLIVEPGDRSRRITRLKKMILLR